MKISLSRGEGGLVHYPWGAAGAAKENGGKNQPGALDTPEGRSYIMPALSNDY